MGYEKKLLHIDNDVHFDVKINEIIHCDDHSSLSFFTLDVHFVLNYLEQMIFQTSTLL